ncbi:hypothetical protein GJ744_005811 [Endocarpon pusillum]|uniref:Prenyltransferase alpha-alpha toroid domain-containing protein n=1 Tax=Endocarpon pusillum TaxID=364733 RepID=A0A8H7A880_9EURO|nr:hypothetical protein GJ744_005811 [Endocarpon pusillum]
MTLAFFIVSALDLLDLLSSKIDANERDSWRNWIFSCQLDSGGFRGFTGTKIGHDVRTLQNQHWDPANVPATFFALLTLLILGDDLSRVRRRECLTWLPKVQRQDGSFGEILGENESIEGGSDLRFCCCAAGVRHILRGPQEKDVQDFDVDRLVTYITACQTYDGGFSEGPGHESHSGLTYCAIDALTLLGRSPEKGLDTPDARRSSATIALDDCTRWVLNRQTTYLEEDEPEDDEQASSIPQPEAVSLPSSPLGSPHATHFRVTPLSPPKTPSPVRMQIVAAPILNCAKQDLLWAGFNGRTNKIADTCYCFWNTAVLAMLDRLHLVDKPRMRRYLLEKTQHIAGGFGKGVHEPPDIMHAYFGLATLATIGEDELPTFDPVFCISQKARQNLKRVSWWVE